jgi:hypothetical protein
MVIPVILKGLMKAFYSRKINTIFSDKPSVALQVCIVCS